MNVSNQVNKKDVKSTLKAVHKGLKLLKDIQKGKLGAIARKDYDEIAKNVLGNANTFINLTSINEEARRSLNWFNRRTLRSVKEMKHELALQLNQNEKIGPDSKVINNEIRQSIEIAIENDITKATTLINDHAQNKEATKEDIQNKEIIEDQVISN